MEDEISNLLAKTGRRIRAQKRPCSLTDADENWCVVSHHPQLLVVIVGRFLPPGL